MFRALVRFACLLAVAVCLATPVAADIPPPPPKAGLKRVPYEHVLKLGTELEGYKFYTFQRLGMGSQETIEEELQAGTGKSLVVPSSSSPSVRTGIVAVPEKVMTELGTKENLAKLLSWDNKDQLPPGVVVHETYGTNCDLWASDPRDKVECVITVSPDEKAGVRFTVEEPAGHGGVLGASWLSPLATLIAGIFGALSIVTLGLWYVNRKSALARAGTSADIEAPALPDQDSKR